MSKVDEPPIDNPISSSAEDVLGRADVAHDLARDLLDVNAADGLVVGVLGPWGSGKSSFVNLMREELDRSNVTTIDFNPWMFSGTQQLVDFFFKELASELRIKDKSRFGRIADGLDAYGDVLSPIALIPGFGGYFDRSLKALRTARQWWKKRSTRPLRESISQALASLEQRIVVVVDDIDRLSTDEIRDIFKLVRLTASFPNVVYLLAFDRERVEVALEDVKVPGRAYLEKIIQLGFDLPTIPKELVRSQIFSRLNPLIDGVPNVRFSTDRWPDIFMELIEPLIGNMRDVTRFVLSARSTIRALGSEVETADLLALEALRVFRPDSFRQLPTIRITLTQTRDAFGSPDDKTKGQAELEKLGDSLAGEPEFVANLVRRVFPAAMRYTANTSYGPDFLAEWKRDHRVAHLDFLNFYLERAAPSEVIAFRRAEKALTLLENRAELATYLRDLRPEDLEDTISGLEAYEQSFPPAAAVPASIVLMNLIGRIPDRPRRGMFDFFRPDLIVSRVVLRLLRRIDREQDRDEAASNILCSLTSYSAQLDFLTLIGHEEGTGQKLIEEDVAARFEKEFANKVASSRPSNPKEEWQLLRVYWWLSERFPDKFVPFSPQNADESRSLFTSARSVSQSQSFDSRMVRTEEVLAWDALVHIVGGDEETRKSRDLLQAADGDTSLVQLIDKYLTGWRPSRDGYSDDA